MVTHSKGRQTVHVTVVLTRCMLWLWTSGDHRNEYVRNMCNIGLDKTSPAKVSYWSSMPVLGEDAALGTLEQVTCLKCLVSLASKERR